MSPGRADIQEWMDSEATEPDGGFEYCCEVAAENGLTYEALRALLAENQQLREFVVAHTLVEKGVTDFDLQNVAVARLERASDQPVVQAVIREALAGDTE